MALPFYPMLIERFRDRNRVPAGERIGRVGAAEAFRRLSVGTSAAHGWRGPSTPERWRDIEVPLLRAIKSGPSSQQFGTFLRARPEHPGVALGPSFHLAWFTAVGTVADAMTCNRRKDLLDQRRQRRVGGCQ